MHKIKKYYHLKNGFGLLITDKKLYIYDIAQDTVVASVPTSLYIFLIKLEGVISIQEIVEEFAKSSNIENDKFIEKISYLIEGLSPFLVSSDKPLNEPVPVKIISKKENFNIEPHRDEKPSFITFNITDYCRRKCIYCYMDSFYTKNMDYSARFLTINRFEDIIKECKQIGIKNIEIGGGDPLNHPNIIDFIKILTENHIDNYLMSTKNFIDLTMAYKLKEAGLNEIQISLDSADPKKADILMGDPGAYDEIIQTIKNLKAVGIKIKVNCVLTSINCTDLPDLIFLLEELGVEFLSVNYYGVSCGRHHKNLYPKVEQLNELQKQIDSLGERNITLFIPKFDLNFYQNKYSSDVKLRSYYRSYCGAMKTRIIVNPDGTVGYCAYIKQDLAQKYGLIFGNLHYQSLIEVWNSPYINQINSPNRQLFANTECASCDVFEKCYPKRCFLRSILHYKNPFSKDPLCKYGDPTYLEG